MTNQINDLITQIKTNNFKLLQLHDCLTRSMIVDSLLAAGSTVLALFLANML